MRRLAGPSTKFASLICSGQAENEAEQARGWEPAAEIPSAARDLDLMVGPAGIELEAVNGCEAEQARGWEPAAEIPSAARDLDTMVGPAGIELEAVSGPFDKIRFAHLLRAG